MDWSLEFRKFQQLFGNEEFLCFGIPLGLLIEFDFSCCYFQVMDVLMALQRSQMETDDPTTSYMLQVSSIVDFNG